MKAFCDPLTNSWVGRIAVAETTFIQTIGTPLPELSFDLIAGAFESEDCDTLQLMLDDVEYNMTHTDYVPYYTVTAIKAHEDVHVAHGKNDLSLALGAFVESVEFWSAPCSTYATQEDATAALITAMDAAYQFFKDSVYASFERDAAHEEEPQDFLDAQSAVLLPFKDAIVTARDNLDCP